MDNVVISRRNLTHKRKGNKENAQPAHEINSFIKRDKTSVAPFQLKSNEKEETLTRNGPLKAKPKQVDTRSACGEAVKKVKPVQKGGKGGAAAAADFKQKVAGEAMKPPAAVPPSRSAPGMYKGKIVQSKIGSIWKSSATVGSTDPKSSVAKTESQKDENVKSRSKSASDIPGFGTHKPESTRSKSVFSKSTQMSKPTLTSHPPAGFCSARPLHKTVPLTSTSSRNTTVAPTKGSGKQNSKTKITVADKVSKPPVTSTVSQYRFSVETAEEKRAKLAEWLASKGKTLKRPAMTAAAPTKTKVCGKPEAELKSQPHNEPQPVAQCEPKPKHSLKAPRPDATAAHCTCTRTQEEVLANSQTPVVMHTTLELLENSDAALPIDPQDRVDDIVVNLCDALEAMATTSKCDDELAQKTDECVVEPEDDESKDVYKKEKLQNEMLEDVSEQPMFKQVKNEQEESDDLEDVENDSATTPQMENASIIKYSVRTTPYLQSVKKTIEGEVTTSNSRRKSNIKDLKFLTPVRRSCRIQRKSSHLPMMLVDHDPCVSSLAELVKLDEDPNAYIYRKNHALLGGLPDQPEL